MDQQPNAMNAPQATPSNEEMEMHNRLYSLSVALLYDKAFIPKAAEVFEKAPTPAAGAATLLVTIGTRLIASAQQQGMEIPGTAFLSAGAMVMQEIAEFAETQLGVKMSPDQIEGAFYSAADQMQTIVKKRGGVRVDVSPHRS